MSPGAVCALTHGMVRWSDLQRTPNLTLTRDAITGKSKMKNQYYLTPWAVPKKGFSGVDWATPWVRALNSDGLPAHDFLLKSVSPNGSKLFERVTNFQRHAG